MGILDLGKPSDNCGVGPGVIRAVVVLTVFMLASSCGSEIAVTTETGPLDGEVANDVEEDMEADVATAPEPDESASEEDPTVIDSGTSDFGDEGQEDLTRELGDPSTIVVPDLVDGGATIAWFNDSGSAALEMVDVTESLWLLGAPQCEDAAQQLQSIGTPTEIASAAQGTPDRPTQEILLGLHAATATALRSCGNAEEFVGARANLEWQWKLADQRLAEVGAR